MGLGLYAFDPELYLAQLGVESDFDLHQVSQLGLDGQMDLQILDLELDLLDAKSGHVELQIGVPHALTMVLPGANGVAFVAAHTPLILQCPTLRCHAPRSSVSLLICHAPTVRQINSSGNDALSQAGP